MNTKSQMKTRMSIAMIKWTEEMKTATKGTLQTPSLPLLKGIISSTLPSLTKEVGIWMPSQGLTVQRVPRLMKRATSEK